MVGLSLVLIALIGAAGLGIWYLIKWLF